MPRELTHVISFRTTASSHRKLHRVRSTFPDGQWGEFFRWLFDQPEVQDVIDQRLNESSPAGADGMWTSGIEATLPAGDR
jgi:hypothetical protein